MIPAGPIEDAWLRDAERRLEHLLCAVTGRLHPNREHPLPANQAAAAADDLDRRIRAGAEDLRAFLS